MSDIRKEIVESCHRFIRETGLNPTRLYIGPRKWDELRRDYDHFLFQRFEIDGSKPPTFDGLDVYLVASHDHLHVTR